MYFPELFRLEHDVNTIPSALSAEDGQAVSAFRGERQRDFILVLHADELCGRYADVAEVAVGSRFVEEVIDHLIVMGQCAAGVRRAVGQENLRAGYAVDCNGHVTRIRNFVRLREGVRVCAGSQR